MGAKVEGLKLLLVNRPVVRRGMKIKRGRRRMESLGNAPSVKWERKRKRSEKRSLFRARQSARELLPSD